MISDFCLAQEFQFLLVLVYVHIMIMHFLEVYQCIQQVQLSPTVEYKTCVAATN
jgi:hypothetical protein